jgi:hypothetical protein
MDPFAEKDLIDCMRAISATLNNIDSRIEELTLAVREIGLSLEGSDEDAEDVLLESEEGEK